LVQQLPDVTAVITQRIRCSFDLVDQCIQVALAASERISFTPVAIEKKVPQIQLVLAP
jgi:hypothetical protein